MSKLCMDFQTKSFAQMLKPFDSKKWTPPSPPLCTEEKTKQNKKTEASVPPTFLLTQTSSP